MSALFCSFVQGLSWTPGHRGLATTPTFPPNILHDSSSLGWEGLDRHVKERIQGRKVPSRSNTGVMLSMWYALCHFSHSSFKIFYLFSEKGRDKERERNINVWLSLMRPLLGPWPAAQACTLTGNRTSDPLVHRLALNPLSHISRGNTPPLLKIDL